MPQIPTLENQVRPDAAPNFQQRPLESTAAQSIGAGIADVGAVAARIQHVEHLKADRAAFMDADRETDTAANDLVTRAQQLQGKDAIGSAPQLLEEFDKAATQTAAGLKSSRAKQAYQESVNARRSSLQRTLDGHEGQQREAYYAKSREDYKDQAHINAVSQYQDPKAIEAEIGKIRAAVDQTPGMDEAQKATELGVRRSGVYLGVVQRYLANDQIGAAEKYYQSIKQGVNGDKAAYIENAITDAKRVAEARARSLQDHSEAIAQRAVNEMDQQISSGVPATPAMWAALENKTRGTSFADEVKGRVNDEREVQDLLRKPIAEQVKEVQDRRAALDTGGGTLRQARNVARLEAAVKQNVQQLQQAPLIYNANRTGTDVPAVDVTALEDPAQKEALQSRVDTISAMRKSFGPQVQMKVLLPQEAAQLGALVKDADSAEVFAKLRAATSSDEAYTAMMQQIAPDSPVKAYAGQIFGRAAPVTLRTHLFSANEQTAQRVVAETMITGENLVNKTKQQLGSDGKPVKALYVPDKTLFDAAFADGVGTSFAGNPDALNLAQQAAFAYYVGKSAQTGRLNAAGEPIDARLMQEAMRATVGEKVNFHGNGDVLPPLGVDADAFENAVHAQYMAEMKARGIPEEDAAHAFRSLGITNIRGQYVMTNGRGPFSIKGKPVIIDLNKAAPAVPLEQRGFVNP
jgi:hypothetical protein